MVEITKKIRSSTGPLKVVKLKYDREKMTRSFQERIRVKQSSESKNQPQAIAEYTKNHAP